MSDDIKNVSDSQTSDNQGTNPTSGSVLSANEPGIGRYIGVWMLAGVIGYFASTILGAAVVAVGTAGNFSLHTMLFVIDATVLLATLGIWVFVYKKAKSLRISRVMPYIYLSSVLGLLVSLGATVNDFERFLSDEQMLAQSLFTIVLWVGFALGFRAAFRNTEQWGE